MLEKCKTWLPVFHGFYGSGLEDDNDLEYTLFDDPDIGDDRMLDIHKNWLIEEVTDYIDYYAYHKEMADNICEAICDEMESHELITGDYTFEGLRSPKYYNFSNDSIDVTVEVDIVKLIEKCKKDIVLFSEYLESHYKSYDGFLSSYSYKPEDWFGKLSDYTDGLIMNNTDHCIGAILSFLLESQDTFDGGYQDLVYEAVSEVPISNYLDWDKMLDGFNEEFGTNAKEVREIESGDVNEVDPEALARRDCTGQKYFKFFDK